jgi:hypothetical protein
MLLEAAELTADAAYLRARAARDDNPDLLRVAAQLSAGSRQSERDAWALAELEARSRPKRSVLDEIEAEAASMLLEAPQSPQDATTAPDDSEVTPDAADAADGHPGAGNGGAR